MCSQRNSWHHTRGGGLALVATNMPGSPKLTFSLTSEVSKSGGQGWAAQELGKFGWFSENDPETLGRLHGPILPEHFTCPKPPNTIDLQTVVDADVGSLHQSFLSKHTFQMNFMHFPP